MSAFRRVEGARAGPAALGILVPPGRRTVVIVRPRGLDWDLLPLRADETPGTPFHEVGVAEAADLGRELRRVFEEGGDNPIRVEPLPAAGAVGYEIRAAIGSRSWVACPRTPGVPYRPAVFATLDEALAAAAALTAVLCPGEGVTQELYFNTHHFTR
jgi:hypothetical protein